ncbi:AraC family transcriptional regulator [Neobacillus niacini]|jgi:hypothetical protein|uniref:AraC family transcriptional regulator n=1 Tax=Neobacillus niacini TaxID=86668 RepID=UPI00358E2F6C
MRPAWSNSGTQPFGKTSTTGDKLFQFLSDDFTQFLVGYKDTKSFTKTFQKLYNMTPKEFRNHYFSNK